jgi:Family of unknown function (DUF5320)
MPGFDQTGPGGRGSMTGRRMGRCTNYGRNLKKSENTSSIEQNDNSTENLSGRGFGSGLRRAGTGRGRGRGMGRQNRFRNNI